MSRRAWLARAAAGGAALAAAMAGLRRALARGTVEPGVARVRGDVRINGKPAARSGDTALTCNDPADLPVGTVVAAGTVRIGG